MATENNGWVPTIGGLINVSGVPMVAHLAGDSGDPHWKVSDPKTACLAGEGHTEQEAVSDANRALRQHSLADAQKIATIRFNKICGPRPEFWTEGMAL